MAGLHLFRCAHAQQVQAVGNHLAYCQVKAHTGVPQGSVFNQHLMGVVVGVELAGQLTQVVGEVVRLALGGGVGNKLRVLGQLVGQFFLFVQRQQAQIAHTFVQAPLHAFGGQFAQYAANPGMGILDVIHRVFIGLGAGQVDIEGQLGIHAARRQEETGSIAAHFVDQVAHGDVAAGALGDFHFLAGAGHHHHLVQNVVRPALGNVGFQCLQAGAYTGNGGVVVRALFVDHGGKTALPLVQVVGYIRQEVGVATVFLAHHAVFVVAELGGFQPHGAVLLVGVAVGFQALNGGFYLAIFVQGRFQEIHIELNAKGFQVQVLLPAQVGHGEFADGVLVVRVGLGGHFPVVGNHGFAGHIGVGYVDNVVAPVAVFRPAFVFWGQAFNAGLNRQGQVVDLGAGVVVVELTGNIVTVGFQQAAQAVANRGATAVAYVQRAGGVGRHKLHLDLLALAGVVAAELLRFIQNAVHNAERAGGAHEKVNKARPGNRSEERRVGKEGRSRWSAYE